MSAAALERQLRPIYDALDTGSNKSAIVTCNKLLKKHPQNGLLKALKALALVRLQKVEESLVLCDEVLASKTTDDATLSAMMHVLRGLGRHADMVTMFEDAYKQQPSNEDLGAQTFFANVRTGNWKVAQQIATKMYKQFSEDRYLYWSIISAVLQANDPLTPANIRTLLYRLAHRLVTSSPTPSYLSADRFYLHLSILRELELYDEANTLLESEVGKNICSTSLICDEIRRDIWRRRGLLQDEGMRAQQRILEKKDRNWLEFVSLLDAAFSRIALSGGTSSAEESLKAECLVHVAQIRELLQRLAEEDGHKDRSAHLALLELEHRALSYGLTADGKDILNLMKSYFQKIGDKACCFEDLKPYLLLENESLFQWTSFLRSFTPSSTTPEDIRRSANIHKLLRYNLSETELTPELESSRAEQLVKEYLQALSVGRDLPSTELQPADDLIILAGEVYVSLWKMTSDEVHLFKAVSVLEFGSSRSKQSFQIRLLLIRIYRILAAPSLALEHYRQMDIKQVQNDTLSHFILSRASTFSLAATGDLTYPTECLESSQIYMSNSQETADFIVRAFMAEKYSQIPDFIVFEDKLDNSLQRDVVKIEHVRMRITHETINSDLIDMELIELKFIFDRFHHDNRDFEILPNYQPRIQESFNQQTLLFDKSPGLGWLWIFLKVYIRAFQQASNLDDTVEDKLLIGDRPKQSHDPGSRVPLKQRLAERKQEELDELTQDELTLVVYATTLADWLEPYHDHTRPPPSAVLAEAVKLSEQKTGYTIKGVDLPPQSGSSTNGHTKKEEETPAVREAPEAVTKFFENMGARFQDALRANQLPLALHIATITQEALIIFTIQTLRFKPPSIVKVHKLGALVQNFKTIRANAVAVLREVSAQLEKVADQHGTIDGRKAFVDACSDINSLEMDNDFLLNIAKRVTDARKKVLDGVGKGIAKVCATHTR